MSLIECEIYWYDKPNEIKTVDCDTGDWNGVEDARDDAIFWYFGGEDPLDGGDEFSVISYKDIDDG
jgi:hypothetical protein